MPADLYLQALMQLAGQLNSDLARRAWRLLAGQTRGVLQLVDAGEIPGIAAGLASAAAAAVALPSVAPVMLQHALATLAAIAQVCACPQVSTCANLYVCDWLCSRHVGYTAASGCCCQAPHR